MSNNRELSEFADYLVVDDTTKNVGIGTTLKISAGGIFVANTEVIRPDGTWGGPDTGLVGAQGAQGAQGAVGAQGAQGAVGAQGNQGRQGAVGAQGNQGAVGAQGAQGAQGYQGAAGSATITNNADNRVITGGTGTNLNGEANLLFDGTNLGVNGAAAQTPIDVISNSSGNGITVRGRSADGLGNIRFTSNNYGTLYGGLNHNATDLNIFNELSGTLKLGTSGQDRFVIGSSGQFGIGGATYGTSGQVLTSQGSGSAPQWATPAGLVDYGGTSANGTSIINITGISLDCRLLKIYIMHFSSSNNNSPQISLRLGNGSVSSASYTGRVFESSSNGTQAIPGDRINITHTAHTSNTHVWTGIIDVGMSVGSGCAVSWNIFSEVNHAEFGAARWNGNNRIDRIQLIGSAGNWDGGYVRVFGDR